MSTLPVLRGVDAVTIPVPDLDQGLRFHRDQLGHELVWRNDAEGQVGLRLPETQAIYAPPVHGGFGREGRISRADDLEKGSYCCKP
jgi:catechol 2,3-dioxygenase-like lactoylglutathione lyase family enzyme